jgi:hypothetical protein
MLADAIFINPYASFGSFLLWHGLMGKPPAGRSLGPKMAKSVRQEAIQYAYWIGGKKFFPGT